jgi:hypothetical protein
MTRRREIVAATSHIPAPDRLDPRDDFRRGSADRRTPIKPFEIYPVPSNVSATDELRLHFP